MGRLCTCVLLLVGAEAFNGPGRPIRSTEAPDEVETATEAPVNIVTEEPSGPSEVVVEEEDYVKAVMHDFDSKNACFEGQAHKSTDCWQGTADGVFYRYACRGNDGKVYTDICESSTCEPESCLGEWTFHQDELSATCYFDGSAVYQFQCTDLAPGDSYEPVDNAARIEGTSDKTCQELGWMATAAAGSSPFVCAASKIGGECHDDKSHAEAEAACAGVGARLCTSDELAADETKGSGCKGDSKRVWSSTACDGGFIHQAGASKNLGAMPAECGGDSATAAVRCCADTVNTNVGVSAGLPAGYQLATTYDYSAEDGACGGEPLRSYSCWTDPATGLTKRFACTATSDKVWSQSCDSGCSDCEGEWNTEADTLGRCYSDPSTGDLYSYDC